MYYDEFVNVKPSWWNGNYSFMIWMKEKYNIRCNRSHCCDKIHVIVGVLNVSVLVRVGAECNEWRVGNSIFYWSSKFQSEEAVTQTSCWPRSNHWRTVRFRYRRPRPECRATHKADKAVNGKGEEGIYLSRKLSWQIIVIDIISFQQQNRHSTQGQTKELASLLRNY